MSTKVNLKEVHDTLRQLETVVQDCYGPTALQCMLCTSTGKLQMTSDGHTILKTLNVKNPVAQIAMSTLSQLHKNCGEGTKTLLFMLAAATEQIQKIVSKGDISDGKAEALAMEKHALALSLASFRNDMLEGQILPKLKEKTVKVRNIRQNSEDVKNYCSSVIHTSLCSKVTKQSQSELADVFCEFLFKNTSDLSQVEVINKIIDEYLFLCLTCPGLPLNQSRVINGVVVQREICKGAVDLSPVVFALVGFSPGNTLEDAGKTTYAVSSQDNLIKAMDWRPAQASLLSKRLKELGVNLLISSEKVDDSTLYQLHKCGISVIPYVDSDEFTWLGAATGVPIVYEQDDFWCENIQLGQAEQCYQVNINGRRCTELKGMAGTYGSNIHTLVLCAPTEGLCQQYREYLYNAAKSVRSLLSLDGHVSNMDSKNDLLMVESGGCFELLFYSELNKLSSELQSTNAGKVCDILKKSLLTVPLKLLRNSYHAQKMSKPELLLSLSACVERGDVPSISTLANMLGKHKVTYEPYNCKVVILYTFLDTLQQILRIDKIISVRKLPREDSDTESE